MKKNRKMTRRMSRVASTSFHFGAVIIVLFAMVILNLLASSSCQQLSKKIGEDEKLLKQLEDAKRQESTRWDQMKTPEKLEAALLRHGLKMIPPHAAQNIYMKADGTPYPGYALAKAKRGKTDSVAKNTVVRRRR